MADINKEQSNWKEDWPRTKAGEKILKLVQGVGDYTFKDIQKIVGRHFPRRRARDAKFEYIVNRILNEYVFPKIQEKANRTRFLAIQSLYNQELRDLARTDGLTGVYTHRYFLERLEGEVKKHPRQKIVMLDLDNFKYCNDYYGHPAGDEALARLAELLKTEFIEGIVGRWGGEEFTVAVGEDELSSDISEKLDRVREEYRLYAGNKFTNPNSPFRGTMSIGIYSADFSKPTETINLAIKKADIACYNAKDAGKDRILPWPAARE